MRLGEYIFIYVTRQILYRSWRILSNLNDLEDLGSRSDPGGHPWSLGICFTQECNAVVHLQLFIRLLRMPAELFSEQCVRFAGMNISESTSILISI